jgi:hypothetical protein
MMHWIPGAVLFSVGGRQAFGAKSPIPLYLITEPEAFSYLCAFIFHRRNTYSNHLLDTFDFASSLSSFYLSKLDCFHLRLLAGNTILVFYQLFSTPRLIRRPSPDSITNSSVAT